MTVSRGSRRGKFSLTVVIRDKTYQIQDGHFHHTLIEVGCLVLDDLHGHDLLGLQVLTFHDLAEGTLTQNVENEVAVSEWGVR